MAARTAFWKADAVIVAGTGNIWRFLLKIDGIELEESTVDSARPQIDISTSGFHYVVELYSSIVRGVILSIAIQSSPQGI